MSVMLMSMLTAIPFLVCCQLVSCCVCGVGVLASMLTAIPFFVLTDCKLLCLWCWCPYIHAHYHSISCVLTGSMLLSCGVGVLVSVLTAIPFLVC